MGEFFTIGCGKMVTKIKDMAIICQWCGVCKCLGTGFNESLTPDIGVFREGHCKLCKDGNSLKSCGHCKTKLDVSR